MCVSGVYDNLRHMTVTSKGGLVTIEEITRRLILVCTDWMPADYEDARCTVQDVR